MKAMYTIIKPVITEKATRLAEKQQYLLYVNPKATKIEIKQAVKELYGADVVKVTSMITPRKLKQMRRMQIAKRGEMKKVMITLKGGKKFDANKIPKELRK